MPKISVIIPCYNEEPTIRLLLDALYTQTFLRDEMEVLIVDGMSTDRTREIIAKFQDEHPELAVRVIDNHSRTIPAALNRAIEAAQGDIFVRLDAHSVPLPDYIERSVVALEAGLGDNVGGIWQIRPGAEGRIAQGIAAAVAHPLGVGDARYRIGGQAQAVDTVPFGTFSRDLIERVGAFDETLLANEDYEFNVRVRKAGATVWMDPAIQTTYYARRSLKELGRQYWRYGYWKLRMLLRYPDTFRWRQLSGVFVLSWVVLGILSISWNWARWLLALETLIYGSALLVLAGLQSARKYQNYSMLVTVPAAVAVMHFSWGTAFLWSLIKYIVFHK
ncbi:MAG: glycosyltransferase family 2 protein [Chloroflexi bacterium]|nr:glycosyltransferase family 2 protein [Chloroflexota bacterium]